MRSNVFSFLGCSVPKLISSLGKVTTLGSWPVVGIISLSLLHLGEVVIQKQLSTSKPKGIWLCGHKQTCGRTTKAKHKLGHTKGKQPPRISCNLEDKRISKTSMWTFSYEMLYHVYYDASPMHTKLYGMGTHTLVGNYNQIQLGCT